MVTVDESKQLFPLGIGKAAVIGKCGNEGRERRSEGHTSELQSQ